MRILSSLLALTALTAACSKQQPEVVPEPVQEQPAPAAPATPAPAPFDRSVCEEAINTAVAEMARMVNFDTDRSEVRAEDTSLLDAKAALLLANPSVRLRLTGHADERYTDEYNLILGTRRAESVRDYLVRKGVEAVRLEPASLGETDPLDPASNETAWSRNRRVEFAVIAGRETLAARIPGCR